MIQKTQAVWQLTSRERARTQVLDHILFMLFLLPIASAPDEISLRWFSQRIPTVSSGNYLTFVTLS